MDVSLKQQTQKFIEEQVKAGHFRSADDLLEEAVARLMLEADSELDDETAAAINRAEEQIDRGEGIEFDQVAEEMRKRIIFG
jgi:Arc/MetJ-type ribon-helix-helix transcriptional regulator